MQDNHTSLRKFSVNRSYTGQNGIHGIKDLQFGFFYPTPENPRSEICYYWKLSAQKKRGKKHFLVESRDKTEIIIEREKNKFAKIEFARSVESQRKSSEESSVSYYELDGCPTFSIPNFNGRTRMLNLNISEAIPNFALKISDDCLIQTFLARSIVLRVVKQSHTQNKKVYFENTPWKEFDWKGRMPFLTEEKLLNSKILYETQFRLLCCLTQLTVDLFFFTEKMFRNFETRMMNGKRLESSIVDRVLEEFILPDVNLQTKPPSCCNFEEVFWDKYQKELEFSKSLPKEKDSQIIQVKSVYITPSIKIYSLKNLNPGNSVLRQYSTKVDQFLIAKYLSEDGKQLSLSHKNIFANEWEKKIHSRSILSRTFNLLAYSASQLKKASFWMLSSTPGFTVQKIRNDIGDLSQQRNPAKYGARLGQLFSDSRKGMDIDRTRHNYEEIPDLEWSKGQGEGKYIYSDGIGKISANLIHQIKSNLQLSGKISVFQVRIGGVKGVLAMDKYLPDNTIQVRPSMIKFRNSCFEDKLDVLHWNKYQPGRMSTQSALLFLTNGIDPHVLNNLLQTHLKALKERRIDKKRADYGKNSERALKLIQQMQNMQMIARKKKDFFGYGVSQVLLYKYFIHQETCLKQKINIPVKKSAYLIGIIDEHGVLGPNEVFVSISPSDGQKRDRRVIHSKVAAIKNPCLHPGDLQVMKAVRRKKVLKVLGHFVNCIVFPFNKGERPHFNKMAGADLDGDHFFVTWDQGLIPKREVEPACYEPRQEKVQKLGDEALVNFFREANLNFNLQKIANSHLVFADKSPKLANSQECIHLSKLHSQEVDYPKTGDKTEIEDKYLAKEYPDFMEKEDSKTYKSKSPLGEFYRTAKEAVEQLKPMQPVKNLKARIEKCFLFRGFKNFLPECFKIKEFYTRDIERIKEKYKLNTEYEIFASINLTDREKYNKETLLKQEELLAIEYQKLHQRYLSKFSQNLDSNNLYQKASALYFACYYRHSGSGQYRIPTIKKSLLKLEPVGLPWLIVKDKLFEIKARNDKERFPKNKNRRFRK